MKNIRAKDSGETVRMRRPPPRVFTDLEGRNVWMGNIEPLELELEEDLGSDPYDSAALRRCGS